MVMPAVKSWEELEEWLGRDLGVEIQGADPVEFSAIRRELEVLEFDCPLHYDDAAARSAGYEGMIAPNHMAFTFTVPPAWAPGDPTVWTSADPNLWKPSGMVSRHVSTPTTASFATDVESEYFAPMYVGDRLTARDARVVKILPKTLRVGTGAFVTIEWKVFNQRDEHVATMRSTSFRYNPVKAEQR